MLLLNLIQVMESISGSVVPLAMFLFSLSQQCHYKQIHILVIFKALVLPVHLPISLFWLCQFHCSLCQWGWEPKTVALSTTRCCQCGVTLKSVLVLVFCICVKLTLTMVTVISVCICVFTCNGQLINFAAATCCYCCPSPLVTGQHFIIDAATADPCDGHHRHCHRHHHHCICQHEPQPLSCELVTLVHCVIFLSR